MPSIHILQGLPGAGKTTFARRQFGRAAVVCTADRFLLDATGTYRFSPERVQAAHAACLRQFVEAVASNAADPIVVDNTNTTVAEMAPYVAIARAYEAPVRIWYLDVPLEVCAARQSRGVPIDVLVAMNNMLATFAAPEWWPRRTKITLAACPILERAYLGIAIDESDEVIVGRTRVCAELGLTPRKEAHVTIAYLGTATLDQCERLAEALSPCANDLLFELRLVGTGAAYQSGPGEVQHLRSECLPLTKSHGCVAWWSVERNASLDELRRAALDPFPGLGLTVPAGQPFCPHVTLGSRGTGDVADEDFDIYSVEKRPTLGILCGPALVRGARLHISVSDVLPASVTCIRAA